MNLKPLALAGLVVFAFVVAAPAASATAIAGVHVESGPCDDHHTDIYCRAQRVVDVAYYCLVHYNETACFGNVTLG